MIISTNEDIYNAGKENKRISWTDEQLDKQIEALYFVISYFEGRGDCGIIVSKLLCEVENFMVMKEARKVK